MLPSLSSTRGMRLQLMAPTREESVGVLARRLAAPKFKKIVSVRVLSCADQGFKPRYTLETVVDTGNNVGLCVIDERSESTSASSSTSNMIEESTGLEESSHRSAFRTEKRLEKFTGLSKKVYDAARMGHLHERCQFCAEVTQYVIVVAPKPDSMTLRLLGEERAKRKLTQFVTGLLELVVGHLSADVRGACAGQARIPQLLYEFLFAVAPQEAETA